MMFQVVSPVDNHVYLERPYSTEGEINSAVRNAERSFIQWRSTPLKERCRIASLSLEKLRSKQEILGKELTLQMGRPIKYSSKEIDGYIERATFMISISEASLAPLEVSNKESSVKKYIKKEPLGIVLVLAAWNYPYLIAVNSVIPALCAGNVVLLKHSTQTPLVAERMVESFIEAGLPEGVFQCLHLNHSDTDKLIKHPSIAFVQFTGSVPGGESILRSSSSRFIGTGFELGGCDAAYVREDADLHDAASNLADGAFFNSGQCCCGIQRIYTNEKIYPTFLKLIAEETIKQFGNIGDPLNPQVTFGPCIKVAAADELRAKIAEDIKNGAQNLLSDYPSFTKWNQNGSAFMSPHILVSVKPGMNILSKELFGPVVCVIPISSDTEAIQRINDSEFGLTASIWTRDTKAAEMIGNELQVGTVFQNKCDYLDPSLAWTGVKNTGRGVTLSKLGYDQLTRPKSFYLKDT